MIGPIICDLIAGAEEKLRLVVSERAAASAAAASLEVLCRQLEQQVLCDSSHYSRIVDNSHLQVASLKAAAFESSTVRFLFCKFEVCLLHTHRNFDPKTTNWSIFTLCTPQHQSRHFNHTTKTAMS
jgi:hypothetical protein